MKLIHLLSALLFVSLCLAQSLPSPPAAGETHKVKWAASLGLKSLADLKTRLDRPFGDVFEGKIKGETIQISNCAEYLAASRDGFVLTGGDQDRIVLHSDAVICVALDALQKAKPATRSDLDSFHLSAEALRELPPELAPEVSDDSAAQAKAADKAGKSWQQYRPSARAVSGKAGELKVREPGWRITLTEYARGDFLGNGSEQILLRADYAATGGTYGDSRLFLLTRERDSKRLNLQKEYAIQ